MLRLLALLVAAGCAGGCAMLEQVTGSPARGAAVATPEGVAPGLGVYLDALEILAAGDPVAQSDTWQQVEQAAASAPTTTNRLRLALAQAVPGHPGSDPVEAQRGLGELLAFADVLLPEERALATIQLHELEHRLVLEEQTRQLQATADQTAARQRDSLQAQLDATRAENVRLQLALEDALQKLDAITRIERSIRERDNGANSP